MKYPIIVLSLLLLWSCDPSLIQIYEVKSNNCNLTGEHFVFENDTIKIDYGFWKSRGILSFSVYNKLDVPIYIDWKNSSAVFNDTKFNYWSDEQVSTGLQVSNGYYYNGPLLKPGYTVQNGASLVTSVTQKPERITFIPPKSNYSVSKFNLIPTGFYKFSGDSTHTNVPRSDKPKKMTAVITEEFLNTTSPLRFRNYLAVSFSEGSSNFYFIDNSFYVGTIKEMDDRHYRGPILDMTRDGKYIYTKQLKKDYNFYIDLNNAPLD